MDEISNIYHYLELSANLATAGQPLEEELAYVAKEGYAVVINLALSDADYSLADERSSVNRLGMEYIHIPVIWESPGLNELDNFFATLDKHRDRKCFIHCAANKRVSVFIALYRILKQGWQYDEAMKDVYKIWRPNAVWSDFISRMLHRGLY